ncbi:MAG: hypothetical protein ACRD5I_08815 [Candidatus Acidiferrales bacterium]
MREMFVAALALGLALAMPVGIFAKAPTAKIIITGGQLNKPLEVAHPEILQRFNPWHGGFRDGSHRPAGVNAPVQWPPPYEVQFYVRFSEKETPMKYVIYYLPGAANERGYIYLPVKGEPWYWHNATTMGTTTGWFRASREWDALIKPLIQAAEAVQRR